MKNYTITVNGNVYDVTVEEGSTNGGVNTAPVPVAQAAPKAAPKSNVSNGTQGSVKINAPMPGKILDIKVKEGQTVKRGDVILLLEAMKMENEVVAPQDGTIVSINTTTGSEVEAGQVLATLN